MNCPIEGFQILKVEYPVFAIIHAFRKSQLCFADDAPAIKLVAVGVDQQLSYSNVFVREIGYIFVSLVRKGRNLGAPIQFLPFDSEYIQTGLLVQQLPTVDQEIILKAVITIHKSDVVALGQIEPRISCAADPCVLAQTDNKIRLFISVLFQLLHGAIRRPVIHENQFMIPRKLIEHRMKGIFQESFTIIRWYDDR